MLGREAVLGEQARALPAGGAPQVSSHRSYARTGSSGFSSVLRGGVVALHARDAAPRGSAGASPVVSPTPASPVSPRRALARLVSRASGAEALADVPAGPLSPVDEVSAAREAPYSRA